MRLSHIQKIAHLEKSLFGLPLVLAGVALAWSTSETLSPLSLLLIVPAFLSARVSGMAFNALIDRHIDAKNPRTRGRPVVTGTVLPTQAFTLAWSSLAIFLVICALLGKLCLCFSLLAALFIALYSYVKRVSCLCHFVLGAVHSLAPLMAYAALTSKIALSPCLLGLSSFFLISGSDIIYAWQDYSFDCEESIHSIPAALGLKKSFIVAAMLHFLSLVILIVFATVGPSQLLLGAPLLAGGVFSYFYARAWHGKNAFFLCNSLVSFSILAVVVVSVWHAS